MLGLNSKYTSGANEMNRSSQWLASGTISLSNHLYIKMRVSRKIKTTSATGSSNRINLSVLGRVCIRLATVGHHHPLERRHVAFFSSSRLWARLERVDRNHFCEETLWLEGEVKVLPALFLGWTRVHSQQCVEWLEGWFLCRSSSPHRQSCAQTHHRPARDGHRRSSLGSRWSLAVRRWVIGVRSTLFGVGGLMGVGWGVSLRGGVGCKRMNDLFG